MKSSAPRYHARRRRSTLRCRLPPASPRPAAGSPCPWPSSRQARRSSARTGDVLADFGARADEHARIRRRDGDRQADDRVDLRHRILPRQGASTIPARRNLANPVQRVARRLWPQAGRRASVTAEAASESPAKSSGGGVPSGARRDVRGPLPRASGETGLRCSRREVAGPTWHGTRQERDETGGSGRIDAGDRPGKPPSGVAARPVRQGSRRSGTRCARRTRQTSSCERVKKLDGPHCEGRITEVSEL